ncbi:hypothetical protein ACLB2K_073826 [Fragaria x ananassa]
MSNVPRTRNNQLWKGYIYMGINYAVYEELDAGDSERARLVYRHCIDVIPHEEFSFATIWLLRYSTKFEAQAHRDGLVSATQEERKLCIKSARGVFERADTYFTTTPAASAFKDEICMLLQQWSGKEVSFGDLGDVNLIQSRILALDSIACSFLEYEADDKPLEATNAIISDACALETLKIASRSSKTLSNYLTCNGAEGLHTKVTDFVRDKDRLVCDAGVLIEQVCYFAKAD